MDHADAVALIAAGVGDGKTWADLGAGRGVFTRALSELLGPESTVFAVDRDARVLEQLTAPALADVRRYHADFREPLELPPLDGLLLANSLHFVAEQVRVLRRLVWYLNPGGRVLLVEYDVRQPSLWNPHPLPPERFQALAAAAGLQPVTVLSRRPSRFGAREFYTAVAFKASL